MPARFLLSLLTLLLIGTVFSLSVFRGNVIDVGMLVYAIPLGAIAFAVIASVGSRTLSNARPGLFRWNRSTRPNPMLGMIVGVVGFGVAAVLYLLADEDWHVYSADASCTGGFAIATSGSGACRVEYARITGAARRYHRHGSESFVLTLELPDGSTRQVELFDAVARTMYDTALAHPDGSAALQVFRNNVALVETSAGRSSTTTMPSHRARSYALFGLALGVLGTVSALQVAFRRAPPA